MSRTRVPLEQGSDRPGPSPLPDLWRRLLLAVALALSLALPASAAGTTTASDLLEQVERNVANVGKAFQQSGLKADDRLKPFLEELRKLSLALDDLEVRAAARDPKAFESLREAGLSQAALQSAWSVSGAGDPGVAEALRKLDSAFGAYRSRFGREAVLSRDSGAVRTGQPRLALLQEENRKLLDRLARLEGQVARNGALEAQVRALRNDATRLAGLDYVGALLLAETLAGRWRGLYGWVGYYEPSWYGYFQPYANDWVVWNDLTVGSVDLVVWNSSDWTWYDAPVDVTWNVDYAVDLTEQDADRYESYVEDQMVDPATPDMSDPDLPPGADPSPDMSDPGTPDVGDSTPDMGDSTPDMDEGPGGMDEGSGDGGGD